ncbi:hypothetical protein [Pedobacter insulae]|uniref:Uncharacterized protein n=1 Tax=Pedobacter insulae TaxID=414048 RepID=A0A1I2ZQT1_9SPHI|nr:hypothetical protein [Pedobacter insulae]SFH40158.1 hypothetical protein SAMN04489864_11123 [Pedobacter insulae]
MNNQRDKKEKPKQSGDAKGKATFDQNGEGNSPKYAQSGSEPNENGAWEDQAFNKDKSKKDK